MSIDKISASNSKFENLRWTPYFYKINIIYFLCSTYFGALFFCYLNKNWALLQHYTVYIYIYIYIYIYTYTQHLQYIDTGCLDISPNIWSKFSSTILYLVALVYSASWSCFLIWLTSIPAPNSHCELPLVSIFHFNST